MYRAIISISMKKKRSNIFLIFLILLLFFDIFALGLVAFENSKNFLSSVWFSQSITSKEVTEKYETAIEKKRRLREKVKILIVPGHDSQNFGAYHDGTTEAEMNSRVAKELFDLLDDEDGVDVKLLREDGNYDEQFSNFLKKNGREIYEFAQDKKIQMADLISSGEVERVVDIHHNTAKPEVVNLLYGVNKFANDYDFDIVLHLHFNDYPGRGSGVGKHNGFSIYVPEEQFSNAQASLDLARNIQNHLGISFPESSNQKEKGIVPDQDLIAIGANNTVEGISLLLEYGYIYEPQFHYENISDVVFKELAYQTYAGVMSFLQNKEWKAEVFGTLRDYDWVYNIEMGQKGESVLALQAFLTRTGYYPPEEDFNQCPINGNFGNCTKRALEKFQEDFNLEKTGLFDTITREMISSF